MLCFTNHKNIYFLLDIDVATYYNIFPNQFSYCLCLLYIIYLRKCCNVKLTSFCILFMFCFFFVLFFTTRVCTTRMCNTF